MTEVYNLNPNYWNPADQGVETVTVTAVPDNNARLSALLTGEADIMSTTRDAQIDAGTEAGNVLISVPNFFAYLLVTDRAGEFDSPLGDERVRRAILLSLSESSCVRPGASTHSASATSTISRTRWWMRSMPRPWRRVMTCTPRSWKP
ncbi:ABC transporter substrate-binding protein [Candidatus Poriferisodalis sp.]|uniref:ABC transporter substrate-binding protein n=1 Tax=Candidatus Poriferisodalis sp. TaxID=3101277 RepID=UPI003B029624